MTTREEIVDGLRMISREGLRTTSGFGPDDWGFTVHDEEGGWTTKQIYCHLTATADILPGLIGALAQAEEGKNIAGGMDINAMNAQAVEARQDLSDKDLIEAFAASYEKAVEAVQGLPEDQLQQKRQFGVLKAPVAELIDTFIILHGLAHVYSAQSRPLN